MPTIAQLPVAGSTMPTDELVVAQGDITRGVRLATLLDNLQPLIVLNGAALLGRTTAEPGGVELITAGAGLALDNGVLSATGAEQAGFALQPALSVDDEIVLTSAGQPRRLPLPLLRGLFNPGRHISIDETGTISSAVPAFLTGAGDPVAGLGEDGDAYLDSVSGALWSRARGSWGDTGNNILATEAAARKVGLAPLQTVNVTGRDVVPTELTSGRDGEHALGLPDARCVSRVTGCVTAQNGASGDVIVWDLAAAIRRAGPGISPQLVGSAAISVFAADPSMEGCRVVLSAGMNGGVLQGIGLAGQIIHWSAALLVVIGL